MLQQQVRIFPYLDQTELFLEIDIFYRRKLEKMSIEVKWILYVTDWKVPRSVLNASGAYEVENFWSLTHGIMHEWTDGRKYRYNGWNSDLDLSFYWQ